jgi:hypothetical protein
MDLQILIRWFFWEITKKRRTNSSTRDDFPATSSQFQYWNCAVFILFFDSKKPQHPKFSAADMILARAVDFST